MIVDNKIRASGTILSGFRAGERRGSRAATGRTLQTIAYRLGLRHAVDADHVAAIDT